MKIVYNFAKQILQALFRWKCKNIIGKKQDTWNLDIVEKISFSYDCYLSGVKRKQIYIERDTLLFTV